MKSFQKNSRKTTTNFKLALSINQAAPQPTTSGWTPFKPKPKKIP